MTQLTQLLQNDTVNNPGDPFRRHYYLMSLSTLYHLDFQVASIDDQNELIDYFFNISYWQFYDLCLLANVVNMINVERSAPYISDILKQYATNNMPMASVETVSKIMINALESSIIQKKYDFTRYLLDKIKKYKFNTDDFKFQTWLLF
ncbi:transcriptional activator [Leuconostoc mesenteroides]